ncbi:MAG: hypothetical protein NNA22_06685 [Nitrospira sp.]|nr:hypothetical protein [Nitrospira sp.]
MSGGTANSQKPLSSCVLTIDRLRTVLREYDDHPDHPVDPLLIGGLAMLAYGHPSRAMINVDGELSNHGWALAEFLSRRHIPSNLGQSLSG